MLPSAGDSNTGDFSRPKMTTNQHMKKQQKTGSPLGPKKNASKLRAKGKKTPKPSKEPIGNLRLRILEAKQNRMRANLPAARKVILSPVTALDLLKLKRADVGNIAGEAQTKGIAAFAGKINGLPFEIRDDCEDMKLE